MATLINGPVKRREFLLSPALAVAGGNAWGQSANDTKMKRIAVMSLCFNSVLKTGNMMPGARADDPNRTVDILDLADIVAERFGIHNVELQHTHLPSTEPEYLKELRNRVNKAKSQISQIVLSLGTLSPSAEDLVSRLEGIDLAKAWVDHAVALGCPRVMVLQGSLAAEVRPTAIQALKPMVAYAKTKNVFITMENFNVAGQGRPRAGAPGAGAPAIPGAGGPGGPGGQAGAPGAGRQGGGGFSAPWDVVVEVCKASGVYLNPDMGNFADDTARKAGLRVMYQMTAGSSHVKYNPPVFSTAECLNISKEVGYKGLYSIEGGRPAPGGDCYGTVKTILDVILENT